MVQITESIISVDGITKTERAEEQKISDLVQRDITPVNTETELNQSLTQLNDDSEHDRKSAIDLRARLV